MLAIASIASTIRCSAESAPIVMSVPIMSLSIEPTRPAIISAGCRVGRVLVDFAGLDQFGDQRRPFLRSRSAPVRLPSPPITISRSMPLRTRLRTALRRPDRSRNSSDRAVPITVPPRFRMLLTSSQPNRPDPVAAVDQALVALVDREDLGAAGERGAHHGANRGVHSLRVAAAGEDSDPLARSELVDHGTILAFARLWRVIAA